ncbi:endo alpha-1,4 polygalactosaminidase [Sphingomonas sp.]|uniref:endo alpha-1,4 polygalactosaminidase n=1 Tax=Sphingomonas sp. TaxID=28214 RepID=UPI003D6CCAA6
MRKAILAAGIASIGSLALAAIGGQRSAVDHKPDPITVVPGPASTARSSPAAAVARTISPAAERANSAPAQIQAAASTWWKPTLSDTWQWQLTGTIKTSYNVKVYDIDLFDAPDATLTLLHSQGRKIICYFSAGSSENWRADFKNFTASDLGSPLDGWAGERWVNTRSQNVRSIMQKRLDLAVQRGCDGVEPDNVDGYANENGLSLTANDQLSYNRFLATEAHRRGLAIGLKNDLDQVGALVTSFDFAVNEQCAQYSECDALRPFVSASKPVFNAEYAAKYRNNTGGARDKLCKASKAANIRTLVLPLALDGSYRYACDA